MDKQLLEMMGKLIEEMAEMRSDMTGMRSEMNKRFDAVDVRITNGFTEIGELFESADRRFDTVEDMTKKIATKDVTFLKHKMNKLEEDVFHLNNDN